MLVIIYPKIGCVQIIYIKLTDILPLPISRPPNIIEPTMGFICAKAKETNRIGVNHSQKLKVTKSGPTMSIKH
jgi:hypothetical protein